MFTLDDYTPEERIKAAKVCETKPEYLWQCAKGVRSPGVKLAMRLIRHDKRLTLESLMAPKLRRDRKIETGKLVVRQYRKRTSKKG